MKTLISNILGIVQEVFKYFNSPLHQRKKAEQKVEDDLKKAEAEHDKIRKAVREKDKNFVNTNLRIFAIILLANFTGCVVERVAVYVPSDREVSPMTNEVGVAGWFVPDTVFEELLIDRSRVRELGKKQDVEKIIKE